LWTERSVQYTDAGSICGLKGLYSTPTLVVFVD